MRGGALGDFDREIAERCYGVLVVEQRLRAACVRAHVLPCAPVVEQS